ncbi:hypothetical protein BP6252_04912 [Coleophoma cylindrospora]|uniref:DUF7702 domain-containing protein n=1 Tax=Coleophoma cylindrospora TaxID=1849047 RepID=A0A3D8S2G8_9HELO|nr:hypothetical protein BP6252_04912 [Coleophoma cylindrospora]
MTKLNQRGDLNAAALAIFTPLFIGASYTLYLHGFKKAQGYIYVILFTLVKLVGAAMSIDVQINHNAALYTPAAILSTVVLSPLLLATASLVNAKSVLSVSDQEFAKHALPELTVSNRSQTDKAVSNGSRFARPSISRLTQLMIIVSLSLGIVGGLDAFATVATNISTGQLYLRIAAGFSVGAWVLICVSLAGNWNKRQYMDGLSQALYPIIAGVVLPLLAVRLVYTCGIAITIDTTMTQVFNALTGSWVLYLCIAWLPEIFIGAAFVAVGVTATRTK